MRGIRRGASFLQQTLEAPRLPAYTVSGVQRACRAYGYLRVSHMFIADMWTYRCSVCWEGVGHHGPTKVCFIGAHCAGGGERSPTQRHAPFYGLRSSKRTSLRKGYPEARTTGPRAAARLPSSRVVRAHGGCTRIFAGVRPAREQRNAVRSSYAPPAGRGSFVVPLLVSVRSQGGATQDRPRRSVPKNPQRHVSWQPPAGAVRVVFSPHDAGVRGLVGDSCPCGPNGRKGG